jgi:hypothetical protein
VNTADYTRNISFKTEKPITETHLLRLEHEEILAKTISYLLYVPDQKITGNEIGLSSLPIEIEFNQVLE